ncbi:hypothetical protein [Candidatus Leptofilum sp.]|uniref:hypothetical protein n=1 Tax=Candidatus Leptofilum sp. TaxID=3241576 RepID=UPI003B591E2A
MAQYVITPINENRAKRWEHVYGRTELPVKFPLPHLACTQRWGDVPVYYLDNTAVPDALLDRLATFEARRTRTSYQEARVAVRREWLIRADECQPARKAMPTPAAPSWQPAFPFLQKVPLRPRRPQVRFS